jgi:hypothetical protein
MALRRTIRVSLIRKPVLNFSCFGIEVYEVVDRVVISDDGFENGVRVGCGDLY